MKTHILVAGLPLKVRARIQGLLSDVQVDSVRSQEELLAQLGTQSHTAVVLHESIVEGSLLPFLEQLARSFHGVVIFCAVRQHSSDDLRAMVHRHRVAAIMQHPIDPSELVRCLVVQLGLVMRPPGLKATHSEEVLLDEAWAEHRNLLLERMEMLQRLAEAAPETLSEAALEEGWRAGHLLAGTLGSFGISNGSLLAREAGNIVQAALEGRPLEAQRLARVVTVMRTVVGIHRSTQLTTWVDSLLLAVSDDEAFLHELEVEALLVNWSLTVCEDLAQLPAMLGELGARAVLLDCDSSGCHSHRELVEELLEDSVPCVVLGEPPTPCRPKSHLIRLPKPAVAYEVMMAVLRTQVSPPSPTPPAILVVDDDKIILKVVSNMLAKIDMHVQTLRSPLDFWDTLEQMKPDVVILDVDLPPLGGIELCRAMRADPRYAAVPVMFLSSYNDREILQRCYEVGADDYLYKPITSMELATRVINRLERTRQIAARPLPAQQPYYPHSSLDQMLLRALREEVPACLIRIECPAQKDELESQALLNRVQRLLRKSLRGEDVVKPLGPLELLVGMAGVDRHRAEKRLASILERHVQALHMGYAQFPDDGTDLGALIELARPEVGQPLPTLVEGLH